MFRICIINYRNDDIVLCIQITLLLLLFVQFSLGHYYGRITVNIHLKSKNKMCNTYLKSDLKHILVI